MTIRQEFILIQKKYPVFPELLIDGQLVSPDYRMNSGYNAPLDQ
jgi:hypothetical protein